MFKMISLAFGVAGAVACSQFPAFSQDYLQRLAGQVDALTVVVMDFDRSALEAGLGREEALQQMSGTSFLDARQNDMRTTFARHTRLADNLMALRSAGPIERLTMPHRFADAATLRATWADFEPALPLSVAGAMAAGIGGVTGWLVSLLALALLTAPFQRLRNRREPASLVRKEPQLRGASRWQDV